MHHIHASHACTTLLGNESLTTFISAFVYLQIKHLNVQKQCLPKSLNWRKDVPQVFNSIYILKYIYLFQFDTLIFEGRGKTCLLHYKFRATMYTCLIIHVLFCCNRSELISHPILDVVIYIYMCVGLIVFYLHIE